MEVVDYVLVPTRKFAKDSFHLVKRCTKPDKKGTQITASSLRI
jgi:hypothetical protein